MIRSYLLVVTLLLAVVGKVSAQNIKEYYVARMQEDGTIYHTFPQTLFEHPECGGLTFDVTYKERQDGHAVINFTYEMAQLTPADSVRFVSGDVVLAGVVQKVYVEPTKNRWTHRYSFRAEIKPLYLFFDTQSVPQVVIYAGGKHYVYQVKKSAWRSYAPIGYKIFETIRYNEPH